MKFLRLPVKDPRTVARDIPGICDLLFPQLSPAMAYLNRKERAISACTAIPSSWIDNSNTNAAMLFEVAYARAEQILQKRNKDWSNCFEIASHRQSKYFDAVPLKALSENDIKIANHTADNLVTSLFELKDEKKAKELFVSPIIFGYQWISKGLGDFSLDNSLIEVKCTRGKFSTPDYRQLLIYWLLSYAAALEDKTFEWERGILLNPRLNLYVEIDFAALVKMAGAGRTKIEILELFSSIMGSYKYKMDC